MYGETGAAMRRELTVLLHEHRIQHRLREGSRDERETHGEHIRRYRQSVLVWCSQAMQLANPLVFTNLPPRNRNPFRSAEPGSAAGELARALEHARSGSTSMPASTELLTTPNENSVVEHWRQAARAAVLAQHDTDPSQSGRFTATQAQALVGDVAAITQALVVLDQRYRNTPNWESISQAARLGWSALAAALDVNLGQPDYSVDTVGWRPLTKPIRSPAKPGILGVLQAEHDLLVRLRSFPHLVNLRLVVDSQRLISGQLVPHARRIDTTLAGRWQARGATYTLLQQQLRDLGGLLGTGGLAAAEAATAVSRLKAVKPDTIVEPRILGGFHMLFDRIDHRIADIIEEGIERGAFAQRVTLPRLASATGQLVQPLRERYRPLTSADGLPLVCTVREQLRPQTQPQITGPGPTRAELHAALIHRPSRRASVSGPQL